MLKTLKMPSYQDDHSEAVVSINTARGRLIEDIYLSPVDYDRLIAGRLQKRPGEQSQYIDNNLDELTDRAENDYQPPAARETVTEPEPDKPKEGTILNDTIKSTPAKKKTGGFTSSRNIRKEVKGA
jgi:hypothetical protein